VLGRTASLFVGDPVADCGGEFDANMVARQEWISVIEG
jgi:hypothetical protein